MIKNYSRPQLLIKQVLEQITGAYAPGLNAFIFGPQFDLNRVNNAEEFAEMEGVECKLPLDDASVLLSPFENYKHDSEIVEDYTRLYGENLEARLIKYGLCGVGSNDLEDDDDTDVDSTGVAWSILSTNTPDKIIAKDVNGVTISVATGKDENLHSSLRGRSVTPGDIVYVTYKGEQVKRQVLGVERALEEAETNTLTGSSLNPEITFKSDTPVVSTTVTGTVTSAFTQTDAILLKYLKAGSRYNGEFAERFQATVTTTTGKGSGNVGRCKITTASGNFSAVDVVITGQAGVADYVISDTNMPGLVITADKDVNSGDGLFLGDTISATASLNYNPVVAANFKFVGTYAYDQDDTLIFEISKAGEDLTNPYEGAIVKVTDTAGRMAAQDVVLSRDAALDQSDYVVLGNTGLSFRLQDITDALDTHQKGLRVSDVYSLSLVVGKVTGKHAVVKLNGIAGNTVGRTNTDADLLIDCVEFRTSFTGFIPSFNDTTTPQWVADDRAFIDDESNDNFGINVFKGLKIKKHDRAAGFQWLVIQSESKYSKLYTHYKAFVPAKENEEIVFLDYAAVGYGGFLTAGNPIELGKVDIENPIAFGANLALKGAQGRGIYVARIATEDVAGYTTILDRAERNSNIYALCPLTDDLAIQDTIVEHVKKMSTEDKKRWRRAYFGTNSPFSYPVIVKDPATLLRPEATITYHQGGNTRVVDELGKFVDLLVRPGDLFRTAFTSIDQVESYKEYVIQEVITNEELLLVSGPSAATTVPLGYEIHKTNSVANIIDYITARSEHFDHRRIVNVWTDGARHDTPAGPLVINNFYVAAEIAGLRSAVQPQQGLTNVQVGVVDSAATMYTKYTDTNLNDVAEDGTWIITQDYEGGAVYIRHQLTTETGKGSLYYEDSVGTNLDEISYSIDDALKGYIGRRNAEPDVLIEIYNDVFTILYNRTKAADAVEIGPALIGFSDLTVGIDPDFRDKVNVTVSLELPLPLNTIVVTLNASASFGESEVSQATSVSYDITGRLLSVADLNS